MNTNAGNACIDELERQMGKIRTLYELATNTNLTYDEHVQISIKLGCKWFGMDHGVIRVADGNLFKIKYIYPSLDEYLTNPTCNRVDENCGCVASYASNDLVYFASTEESPQNRKECPLHNIMQSHLGSYIIVNGKRWGSFLLFSYKVQEVAFSSHDLTLFQLLVRWIGTLIERSIAQEKISNQQQKLYDLHHFTTINSLISGLGHEINNPLAIIMGRAAQIRGNIETNTLSKEELVHIVERIECGGLRISEIIKSLKVFSSSNDNDSLVEIVAAKFLTEIQKLCTERFRDHEIDIVFEIHDDQSHVKCHVAKIAQAILALINNAFDVLVQSDILVKKCLVSLNYENGFIQFSVQDTAGKISEDLQKKIFEPFFTTKEVGKAMGLGLNIAKSIAESHGGTLYINNEALTTCFVFSLPVLS